jgi:uncharacterized protein YbjT (DUF2867 family)
MYVITGATGNTGGIVARSLLAKNQTVRVVGRSAERLKDLANLGAEPLVCDLVDESGLIKAFTGARAVYAMIPPHPQANDYRSDQDDSADSIAGAIEKAGVRHVVVLSSFGADKPSGTGPVAGLHVFEEKLNKISAANTLCLRAGYFMENTLAQIGIIKQMGVSAGPLQADLKLPMIATRDIGEVAADELLKLDFRGHQTRELLGQRDITMAEAASIIGSQIEKPSLGYFQAPDNQVRAGMLSMGMSPNFADLVLEMAAGLNSGHMRALEPRDARNTTPTSYETFVKEEFAPRYFGKAVGA